MTKPNLIAGKPKPSFYQLPFDKGSRVLTQQTLEAHNSFKAAANDYYLYGKEVLSFRRGLVTMEVSQINDKMVVEKFAKIYFKVTSDHLLISCDLDTDSSYLGWNVYRLLRSLMRNGAYDFKQYYWPACFDETTGRSKFVKVFNDRRGFEIELKKNFKGLFRPDDSFPALVERIALERGAVVPTVNTISLLKTGIGYCLANTILDGFHSHHYPFLVPYAFTANTACNAVKSFNHFVFSEDDATELTLSPQQEELNESCYEMKKMALLHNWAYYDTPERKQEVNAKNLANREAIHQLWNKVWPLLLGQNFTHYWFTYGMRNVQGKPMKKLMEEAKFAVEVPRLNLCLADKGDYYELMLRFKINGRILRFSENRQALPLVRSQCQPELWYLLEATMDVELVQFFGKFNFKIQVPKAYYAAHFERHVKLLEEFYELVRR